MFNKWCEIENHYNQKNISLWIERYPRLNDELYIITEKIHGANVQFIIDSEGYKIASRGHVLADGEGFYDVQNVSLKYIDVINGFINYIKNEPSIDYINLYGEIFGQGIQKGVDYGKEKQICFFGMMINGKLTSQFDFHKIMNELDVPKEYIVPIIDIVEGLQNAIDCVDVESLVSNIKPYDGNIAEGVVIQPYREIYFSPVGDMFILKKKSEKFKEKSRERKVPRESSVIPEEILIPKMEFESYINDNRLDSVFSKEGIIDDVKDIGKYIKLVMEDAKKDFEKENDISHLNKKDQRIVFSGAGPIIAKMLQKSLQK
jgi:Rnl2 family RNA ligase